MVCHSSSQPVAVGMAGLQPVRRRGAAAPPVAVTRALRVGGISRILACCRPALCVDDSLITKHRPEDKGRCFYYACKRQEILGMVVLRFQGTMRAV